MRCRGAQVFPAQRRASFAPAAGFGVTTTGTTTVLSSYLTVILAFPAATPETPPSLVTAATVGRSDVYVARVERVTSILEPSAKNPQTCSGVSPCSPKVTHCH